MAPLFGSGQEHEARKSRKPHRQRRQQTEPSVEFHRPGLTPGETQPHETRRQEKPRRCQSNPTVERL